MTEKPSLRARLDAGDTIYTAWVGIPEPMNAEVCGRSGYDAVTLDMQHGFHDYNSVFRGISAIALTGVPAIVRIPVGDNAMASRALDAGADAVIAPMINSAEQAREFAGAVKFPPVGERSWGPARVVMLKGCSLPDYLEVANRETLSFAMIETPRALEAIDEIMTTPGIDGVFMGPSDLSLTLSNGAEINATGARADEAAARIAAKAREHGLYAAGFAPTPQKARDYREMGYRLIAVGSDALLIKAGAEAFLKIARS